MPESGRCSASSGIRYDAIGRSKAADRRYAPSRGQQSSSRRPRLSARGRLSESSPRLPQIISQGAAIRVLPQVARVWGDLNDMCGMGGGITGIRSIPPSPTDLLSPYPTSNSHGVGAICADSHDASAAAESRAAVVEFFSPPICVNFHSPPPKK